ncbi:hypothetical protein QV65_32230 [Rhodococcus erythropolis]|nr:hypothetical protein QV65_32230 [Rhodococcus erythropolis]
MQRAVLNGNTSQSKNLANLPTLRAEMVRGSTSAAGLSATCPTKLAPVQESDQVPCDRNSEVDDAEVQSPWIRWGDWDEDPISWLAERGSKRTTPPWPS